MIKKFNKILFATDLSVNCKYAFTYATSLAVHYDGGITLLHVMEDIQDSLDSRLKAMLGQEKWDMIQQKQKHDTRSILIGKKSELKQIREALTTFSEGDPAVKGRFAVENILVKSGQIVDTIIETASEENCDLIVIGSNKTLFSDSVSLGNRAKSLFKRSKIPILMVPPLPSDEE